MECGYFEFIFVFSLGFSATFRFSMEEKWGDLLPLPLLQPDAWQDDFSMPKRGSLSQGAYRRQNRRADNVFNANKVISAVNSLGGFKSPKAAGPTVVQDEAMRSILRTVAERPRSNSRASTREAVCELLHYRETSSYIDDDIPGTTVRPYHRDLVSLPEPGATTIDALDLVDGVGKGILQASDTTMLRDFEKDPPKLLPGEIVSYMDEKLKNSSELYNQFVIDLYDRGMLEFDHKATSIVTPFFVAKKSGKLRLVLDCRCSNTYFCSPPDIALPAGYSFSQLELSPDEQMYIAQTDIRDYFYSIGMPPKLRRFFALPRVNLKAILPLHPLCDGVADDHLWVHPILIVVPMGWSWAMFIAQRVHQHQSMLAAEVPISRVLVDGRPAPPLSDGPVLVPYADNLNVVGVNKEEVQEVKSRIVKHLQSLGFRIHEEQDALPYAESLGFLLDGKKGKIFPKPAKVQKVQVVLDWLAKSPRVSGKMIERAIGHCIHFCMLRRELLSVFRAIYDFKITHYSRRVKLWSTAAHECACMSSLLNVCFADLRRPWCNEVTASDASLSGTATCAAEWPPDEVRAAGRQRELWRFRAEGSATKARDHVRTVDPFNDLESVKPINQDCNPFDEFRLNLEFMEIPHHLLTEEQWVTLFASRMTHPEHITLLEGRGIVQAQRHKARSSKFFHCRHVHLNDNLGMVLSFDRGRAKDNALLFQCRRSAALSVAMDCEFHFRWIPSELNIADSPSRSFEPRRHGSKRQKANLSQELIYPGIQKERSKSKFSHQSTETERETLCRSFQGPSPSRSEKKDRRQHRGREKSEKNEADKGARCQAEGFNTDISGASCSLSKDRGRLQDENGCLQHVLFPSQVDNSECADFGLSTDHLSSTVLQRRDGFERGNQVSCCDHGFAAGSSGKTYAAKSPQITQRLEELGSRKKSSSNSLAFGGIGCQQYASSSTTDQCDDGADHVCDLLPAIRTPHSGQERPHRHQHFGNDMVSQPEQGRSHGNFQDGSARRVNARRQSTSSLVGQCSKGSQQKTRQSTKMFPQDYYTFLKHWKQGLVQIGLEETFAVPYQLRHAGASWDRFKKFRSQLEVKMRGRWAADSSMTRYEKHALLNQIFEDLPQTIQNDSRQAMTRLKAQVQKCLGLRL